VTGHGDERFSIESDGPKALVHGTDRPNPDGSSIAFRVKVSPFVSSRRNTAHVPATITAERKNRVSERLKGASRRVGVAGPHPMIMPAATA
jgi:hypothetical protein